MTVLKKIGRFFAAMIPLVVVICISYLTLYTYMVIYALKKTAGAAAGESEFIASMYEGYWTNPLLPTLLYQLTALAVFGLFYYFRYGRKGRAENIEKPTVKSIVIITAAGLLLQITIQYILVLAQILVPGCLDNYIALMEQAKIADKTWMSFATAVVAAPIVEELVFRGVTLRLAEKVSTRFWAANLIQALAFGIVHMNPGAGKLCSFLRFGAGVYLR